MITSLFFNVAVLYHFDYDSLSRPYLASKRCFPYNDYLCFRDYPISMFVLIAQFLLRPDFQDWVNSRTPAKLCHYYERGYIPDRFLPGGRSSTPCGDAVTNPLDYVPK